MTQFLAAAVLLLAAWTGAEEIKLTTTYPAPSGTYNQIITTGGGNRNTLLCRDGGKVGIGLGGSAPSKTLDVSGDVGVSGGVTAGGAVTAGGVVRVGILSSDPAGSPGMLYYNTSTNKFRGYQGSGWVDLAVAACVPNGTCGAAMPACGTTTSGVDNCGTYCTKTGDACVCVPNGSCSASTPACGTATSGVDNCGTSCTKTGDACLYECPTKANDGDSTCCNGGTRGAWTKSTTCKGQTSSSPTCTYYTGRDGDNRCDSCGANSVNCTLVN